MVHPFAVFDFARFRDAQKFMLDAHVLQQIPRGEIVRTWLESIGKLWVVAFGLAASIGHLMVYRFRGSAERRMFSLISLYNVAYLGWLIYNVCPPGKSEYIYPVYPFSR